MNNLLWFVVGFVFCSLINGYYLFSLRKRAKNLSDELKLTLSGSFKHFSEEEKKDKVYEVVSISEKFSKLY